MQGETQDQQGAYRLNEAFVLLEQFLLANKDFCTKLFEHYKAAKQKNIVAVEVRAKYSNY